MQGYGLHARKLKFIKPLKIHHITKDFTDRNQFTVSAHMTERTPDILPTIAPSLSRVFDLMWLSFFF